VWSIFCEGCFPSVMSLEGRNCIDFLAERCVNDLSVGNIDLSCVDIGNSC